MECVCTSVYERVWLYLPCFPVCVCVGVCKRKKHMCAHMYAECVRPRFSSMLHLEIPYPSRSRL